LVVLIGVIEKAIDGSFALQAYGCVVSRFFIKDNNWMLIGTFSAVLIASARCLPILSLWEKWVRLASAHASKRRTGPCRYLSKMPEAA
jgi:hypothetical protein